MFIITGLPRMRSAWFAALLSDGIHVAHDIALNSLEGADGWSDPAAACWFPDRVIQHEGPVVLIVRSEIAAYSAFIKWSEVAIPPSSWDTMVKNYHRVKNERDCLIIPFDALDSFEVVEAVAKHCGRTLSKKRWDLFKSLKIEQDFEEARKWLSMAR